MAYEERNYAISITDDTTGDIKVQKHLGTMLLDENPQELWNRYKNLYATSKLNLFLLLEVSNNVVENPFNANNFTYFVEDYTTSPPVTEPKVGKMFIVDDSAVLAWAGQEGKVALYTNIIDPYDTSDANQWVFVDPDTGAGVYYYDRANNKRYTWNSATTGDWGEV